MVQGLLTLAEAREVSGTVVYAIQDPDGVFYVGKTKRPNARFRVHAKLKGENLFLVKRLREAGDTVRVRILAINPPDPEAVELENIRRFSDTLVNYSANPAMTKAGVRVSLAASDARSLLCPNCRRPRDVAGSLRCSSCSEIYVRPSSEAKAHMRAEAAAAVAAFRAKAA